MGIELSFIMFKSLGASVYLEEKLELQVQGFIKLLLLTPCFDVAKRRD